MPPPDASCGPGAAAGTRARGCAAEPRTRLPGRGAPGAGKAAGPGQTSGCPPAQWGHGRRPPADCAPTLALAGESPGHPRPARPMPGYPLCAAPRDQALPPSSHSSTYLGPESYPRPEILLPVTLRSSTAPASRRPPPDLHRPAAFIGGGRSGGESPGLQSQAWILIPPTCHCVTVRKQESRKECSSALIRTGHIRLLK